MTVPLDLDGAAAVLTGAGSGIGRATAISLAARGARSWPATSMPIGPRRPRR